MSRFQTFLDSRAHALAEGAVLERIRRDPALKLDPHILNAGLIYEPQGRAALEAIHRSYMDVAREADLPLLAFTDTWRCAPTALAKTPYAGKGVHRDHVRFLQEIRASLGEGAPIFIGGLIGPSADAYQPKLGLSREAARDFHHAQLHALAEAEPDFLFFATAPNIEEALGAADVMAALPLPFIISFVIRRNGTVLDGTPLGEAMERFDRELARPPAGFAVNCVHAAALDGALAQVAQTHPRSLERLLAFQANTADCEVEDLDESADLISEAPEVFATHVSHVRERYGLRVVGGCCGTQTGHISALAKFLCR